MKHFEMETELVHDMRKEEVEALKRHVKVLEAQIESLQQALHILMEQ